MRRLRLPMLILALAAAVLSPALRAQHQPTIAQYLKPGFPVELVAARTANRIAWIAYEEGKRNVFTAVGPAFRPVRVTAFLEDDGVDMTDISISDDGGVIAFVRGSAPNRDGWVANPASDPHGAERAIWAVRTAGGAARRLAEGSSPALSPDGRFVLYVNDGQIYRARIAPAAAPTPADKGEKPYITAWGRNSGPEWSPDGSKIIFTSNRNDHSFVALYDVRTASLSYVSPSVDRDTSPIWSADGKQIVFLRRPGLPFGQQETPGRGSGLPAAGGRGGFGRGAAAAAPTGRGRQAGPPSAPSAPGGRGAATGAPGGRGAAAAAQPDEPQGGGRQGGGRGRGTGAGAPLGDEPGLYRAALPDGSQLDVMVADVATGEAREVWHPAPDDREFTNINNFRWADGHLVFPHNSQDDDWDRYYSLSLSGDADVQPVLLTPTDGLIEGQASVALSRDGKTLFYCTNAGDIDRRHIWSVPVAGGQPAQVTTGEGIENTPVVLASGRQIAVLSADAKRPMSVGVWPSAPASPADSQKVVYPALGKDFPIAQEVVPTNVTLTADDGVEFHNQLFLPADLKPGERRPALIFVHGGPARQMLLGWHYLSFYHVFYGVNQWLVSQGYIVMSVNYRSGIGYGRSFQRAPNTGARGNAEYKDVLAAGKWLAARADVDPERVGIWGLSYGGLLTAEALSRNSDIFKAGVDLAGVHLEGSSLDPADVSYTSSAISEIDHWKSPVLLVQGDDDRNVNFSQTVGLVQLLRARHVYYELIVYPDDVHETLLHKRWLYTFSRMETFLNKFLGAEAAHGGGQ